MLYTEMTMKCMSSILILEGQDLPCTYLAHHELECININHFTMIVNFILLSVHVQTAH